MIVSVHIPRTAGSSFRATFRRDPNMQLIEDYGNPIMVPNWICRLSARLGHLSQNLRPLPQSVDVVHGHFLPYKYIRYYKSGRAKFICWMRDPADRIRSQYDFCFQSDKKIDRSPFQHKVAREGWRFEDFYRHPLNINLYEKFLWNFPVEQFEFIGIVEYYESDYKYFCTQVMSDSMEDYVHGNRSEPSNITDEHRKEIRELNQVDYSIYAQALNMREQRLKKSKQVK